jgi:pimeloyl-ACP methyl ester carboxylesterase
VVLVHGGGVTRKEGGFSTRLAIGPAEAGLASPRFDLRGHGKSEGRQEELTPATFINDIRVAPAYPREAQAPTLIVHGTKDTFVPVEAASRAAVRQFGGACRLVEIEGAQNGFAVRDDPQYLNPQSQEWQAFVIRTATEWLNQEPWARRAARTA